MAELPSKLQGDSKDGKEAQGILDSYKEDEEAEMEVEDFLDDSEDNDNEPGSDDDGRSEPTDDMHPDVPVIYPRMRFSGHCNVETVKDGEHCRKASTCARG